MHDKSATFAGRRAWHQFDAYPWVRLFVALLLGTIGGSGMYVVVVVLPEVQAEFGTDRMAASIPYTLTMVGFGAGSILMGPLTDRFRVFVSVLIGATLVAIGFTVAAHAPSIAVVSLGSLIIGVGSSATFAPMMADISLWFERRRGVALAIVSSGNYVAGAFWPPLVRVLVDEFGWRNTYLAIGIGTILMIFAMAWVLRPASPGTRGSTTPPAAVDPRPNPRAVNLPLPMIQWLLCLAGIGCCVGMSMPQVHIVALCTDLGYGAARGAEMLSLMLGCGIFSRLASGWISDRIGGVRTLLLGATLQAMSLVLFLPNQSVEALYIASAIFGLVQGGIVPSYAMIVRENFPAAQSATRVGLVITSTLGGMAIGGWISGTLFDWTGAYTVSFFHSITWNFVTIAVALLLLSRSRPRRAAAFA